MDTKKQKALILTAVLVLLSVLLYSFINQPSTQPPLSPNTGDNFLIGVMSSYDFRDNYYEQAGGLNISHNYLIGEKGNFQGDSNRWTPKSNITGQHLYGPVPLTETHSAIDNLYQHNNSQFFWMSPKIEWLCGACPALACPPMEGCGSQSSTMQSVMNNLVMKKRPNKSTIF
jgi:hypothetical protein